MPIPLLSLLQFETNELSADRFPFEPAVRNLLLSARLNPGFYWWEGSMSAGPVARGVAVAIGTAFVAAVTVAIVARLFMMVF
jgi:hypothetical protein